MSGIVVGDDGTGRCWWCAASPEYEAYHDTEWGRPQADEVVLFEKLCLEGFQAGLSWITILRKRAALRTVFAGFDPQRVARFDERDIQRLLADAAIIRHRGKIEAAIQNARTLVELWEDGASLSGLVWAFEPTSRRSPRTGTDIPAVTQESEALARELRRRGFRFVGPTTAYAFMQSMGMVNDHLADCHTRNACEEERRAFARPSGGSPGG